MQYVRKKTAGIAPTAFLFPFRVLADAEGECGLG